MNDENFLPAEIARALEGGTTVVTGNQRAARSLRIAFDRRNRALRRDSWKPAAVLAWDEWMAGLWHSLLLRGHTSKMLLNRSQEHAVWHEILSSDPDLRSLRIDSLAEMASTSWRLLCSYNGQRRLRGAAVSEDTRAFERWALKFESRCKTDALLPQAQLEENLQTAVMGGHFTEMPPVILLGFDAMTPAQSELVNALRDTGITIEEPHISVAADRRLLVAAQDEYEELRLAARGVRRLLEERPGSRVAIIVPNLEEQRAEIDRVLREVLAPEMEDIAAGVNAGPFEFSIGAMLADTPMVATALDLLHWCQASLPLERASRLLLSPYFAATTAGLGARAEFDAFDLRKAKMLRPEISLTWLIDLINASRRRTKLASLLNRLRSLSSTWKRLREKERRSYSEWSEVMGTLLSVAGWGADSEDSIEFQTRRKWESALDELATLDFHGRSVDFAEALESIKRIARQTMFSPASRETSVQVMGPLEAAGATFDAIWFLQSGDLTWPPIRISNPLLPWPIQKALGMPGMDAQRDSEYARRTTERIAESAPVVVFSYAIEPVEGRQHPSPILSGLGLKKAGMEEVAAPEKDRAVIQLEHLEDAAPLPKLPDRVMHGGAKILQLQAACGFRAFAERRLWSTEPDSVAAGLDAAERGTLVHLVLERFWNEVKTQNALRELPLTEREALLARCIDSALEKTAKLCATPWDTAYLNTQRERLRNLLEPWLDLELKRPPFKVKQSEKELRDVRIGPLRLNVRVDRVDIGRDGDIIIDYKTGAAKPGDWLSERPDAPQLPLYAVLSDAEPLEAIAFAQVRAGKDMGLQGFATSEASGIRMPKRQSASFEERIEEWRRVLTSLAEDFFNGDARVWPKHFPLTCARCAQRLLCRVEAASFETAADEEPAMEVEGD
jgi:probable DNA repair protein